MLVANYNIALNSDMMVRAVKTQQMDFLYCVYAFNKNYEFIGDEDDENSVTESSEDSNIEDLYRQHRTFTFDYLIKLIMAYCEEDTH